VVPLNMEIKGEFAGMSARVGTPVEFNPVIKELSGTSLPFAGELTVTCPALEYENKQTVTITPGPLNENPFTFAIPVKESVPAGSYSIEVTFDTGGNRIISQRYTIQIPAPGIKLSEPHLELSAGGSFNLILENTGGKNGNYQIEAHLKDDQGKRIVEYTGTPAINAGQQEEINITVPPEAKSGRYLLYQKAKETHTGKELTSNSQHHVTGLSATLIANTLKEKYFDIETVTGKAEITSGSGTIAGGTLKIEILKNVTAGGVSELAPGDFGSSRRNFEKQFYFRVQ
ncbi:MAG: hypothetical protein GY757_59560, partial [bacterium]|nr:hypothetical protein [bacterium]